MAILFIEAGRMRKLFWNPLAWRNRFFAASFYISFALALCVFAAALFSYWFFRANDAVSLHYSIYFGVDWIGGLFNFVIFGALAAAVFVINFILSNLFFNKQKILAYIFSGATMFTEAIIFAAIMLVIYTNLP